MHFCHTCNLATTQDRFWSIHEAVCPDKHSKAELNKVRIHVRFPRKDNLLWRGDQTGLGKVTKKRSQVKKKTKITDYFSIKRKGQELKRLENTPNLSPDEPDIKTEPVDIEIVSLEGSFPSFLFDSSEDEEENQKVEKHSDFKNRQNNDSRRSKRRSAGVPPERYSDDMFKKERNIVCKL